MKGILQPQELRNDGPHTFTILTEDSLEYSEVELSHLKHSLIEHLRHGFVVVLAPCIEGGWLERLNNHIISVDHFLW